MSRMCRRFRVAAGAVSTPRPLPTAAATQTRAVATSTRPECRVRLATSVRPRFREAFDAAPTRDAVGQGRQPLVLGSDENWP